MRSRDGRLHLGLPALAGRRRLTVAGLALVLALAGLLVPAVAPSLAQQLTPQLELNPSCAEPAIDVVSVPNLTINLRGHSFPADATLLVDWWDREPDTQRQQLSTDRYGRTEGSILVRQPRDPGSYRVWITAAGSDAVLAEAFVSVPCPGTVTIDPACADAPTPGGQLGINVSGQGWSGYFGLIVTFEDSGQVYAREEVSVANGSFSTRLAPPSLRGAPALTDGLYAVVVYPQVIEGPPAAPVSVTPFTLPCYSPTVSATPDCGPAGDAPAVYDIELSGSGFMPITGGTAPPLTIGPPPRVGYLEILFDAGGIPQRFVHVADVAPDGSWGPLRIQPFQRQATVSIRVRQLLAPSHVLLETTIPFTVPCPQVTEPTATIEPDDCALPAFEGDDPNRRYSLTVAGQGFDPGPVEIYFDALGQEGYPVEPFAAAAAADGSFSQPINPLARPVGSYEVHLRQQRADGTTTTLQLSFDVPCELRRPTLSLACDPLEPAAPDAGEVVIDSSGWFEDAPIFLSVTSLAGETVRSDSVGRYTRRLPAGDLPAGALEVIAVQRDIRGTVVAEARGLIPLPCGTPPEPLLRVLPQTAPPGFVVSVEGSFFPPDEAVNLVWDRGLRAGQAMPVTADDTGTFRLQVLIFHHDFLGPREVNATRVDDPLVSYTEEPAELLVVPGRGSPPAFVPPDGLTFEPDTRIVLRR